jgi:hypothetical protein
MTSVDSESLKQLLLAREAELAAATAEAATLRARASDDQALIAHLKLQIEKLRREKFGARSERSARLLDQLELQLEDLEASATEDELAAEKTVARTTEVAALGEKARRPQAAELNRGLHRMVTLDRRVVENCRGLKFIVLDELHTYRGRQGADVAMRSSARTTTSSYEIVRALGAPHAAEVASYGSRMLSSRPRSSGYRKYEITRREPTFISAVRVIPGGIRNPSGKSRSRISVRSMSTR